MIRRASLCCIQPSIRNLRTLHFPSEDSMVTPYNQNLDLSQMIRSSTFQRSIPVWTAKATILCWNLSLRKFNTRVHQHLWWLSGQRTSPTVQAFPGLKNWNLTGPSCLCQTPCYLTSDPHPTTARLVSPLRLCHNGCTCVDKSNVWMPIACGNSTGSWGP